MTKEEKRKKALEETNKFKENYDDVKTHTRPKYDW